MENGRMKSFNFPTILLARLPVFLFSLFILHSAFWILDFGLVSADRLESDSFVIQFGNFNMTAGEKSSASYNVTDTVGQDLAGPFGQYGSSDYFVGAGFQYIYQINTFAFAINDVDIDLGVLTPGVHNSASNGLTITTRGAGGYSIYAHEINPLRHSNGVAEIPDTTCDNTLCDETDAEVWTNQNIAGFGFNVVGNDKAADFVNNTYFRQFADISNSEVKQIIASDTNIAESEVLTVTYKAGVEGDQASGNYQTGIVYTAVPGY